MKFQTVVCGKIGFIIPFLALGTFQCDCGERLFRTQTRIFRRRMELLMQCQVGIAADRAGEMRIARFTEPVVQSRLWRVGGASHGAQEICGNDIFPVVVRQVIQKLVADFAVCQISRHPLQKRGDEEGEFIQFFRFRLRVNTVDPGIVCNGNLFCDGAVGGEHAFLDKFIGFPLFAAFDALNLMCRFIAEHADFRSVEGEKLFPAFAARTHFASRFGQQSNGVFEFIRPCFRCCAVNELLNFIVIQPVVDSYQRKSAAPSRFRTVRMTVCASESAS